MKKIFWIVVIIVLIVAARSSKAECYPAKTIAKGNLIFWEQSWD